MTRQKLSVRRQLRHRSVCVAILLALVNGLGSTFAWACRENAMIVFDASGSMALFRDGSSKIDVARKAAADVLPDVTKYRPTGLVTYGGGKGPACTDVDLRVEPQVRSGGKILAALDKIKPDGATPLSQGVRLATETLQRRDVPGVVVVVTDGLENCGGRTCELARKLKSQASNIRIHVISFFLHGRRIDTLTCLTEATKGVYTSANSLESLRNALRELLSCQRISQLNVLQ